MAQSADAPDATFGPLGRDGGMDPGAEPMDRAARRAAIVAVAILGALLGACAGQAPIVPSADPPATSSRSAAPSTGPSPGPNDAPTAIPAVVAGDRLDVACSGDQTIVDVPRVRARPDGLHLQLMNTTGALLGIEINHGGDGTVLHEDVAESGQALIASIAPGAYEISCGGPPVDFLIVDPTGIYVSATLACDTVGGSGTAGSIDYGPDARGPRGLVIDVARRELRGLQNGDLVEPAGYPATTSEHLIRVVRGGATVAALAFSDDGLGGWLLVSTRACAGSGVTAQPPD